VFNVPLPDRPTEGDTALPLLQPRPEADARIRQETNQSKIKDLPPDLAAALEGLRQCIDGPNYSR
jgi:hypothetical protein